MTKKFCDLCGKEIAETNICILECNREGKLIPEFPTKEICVFCKEELRKIMANWNESIHS